MFVYMGEEIWEPGVQSLREDHKGSQGDMRYMVLRETEKRETRCTVPPGGPQRKQRKYMVYGL